MSKKGNCDLVEEVSSIMRILFVIRTGDIFPYFRSIVVSLIEKGHTVRYLSDLKWTKADEAEEILGRFRAEHERFEYGYAVNRDDRWRKILFHTRELLGYRMYLVSTQSPFYERRWLTYLPKTFQRLFRYRLLRALWRTALVGWFLRGFERIAPADKGVMSDIASFAPDVVVCNPTHARCSSADLEYLKAAKRLGIPTVIPVAGWDNLTTKGAIAVQPDLLLAWNDVQRAEAMDWHGTPEQRIRFVGAAFFDDWFSYQKPSVAKREFCAQYGLREQDPIFLYLGSSKNMAENEVWLVERLHAALTRLGDERLKRVQFLVRPHPANYLNYKTIANKDIVITPKGELPKSKSVMQTFYDALYHTSGVVGVNTSAMLMAAIAGKPILTMLTDTYRATQGETQHFTQLLEHDVLDVSTNDEEFAAAARRILDGKDIRRERRAAFIKKFLRPHGLARAAGEEAAAAIITLAQRQ